jgi:hypothetical protein
MFQMRFANDCRRLDLHFTAHTCAATEGADKMWTCRRLDDRIRAMEHGEPSAGKWPPRCVITKPLWNPGGSFPQIGTGRTSRSPRKGPTGAAILSEASGRAIVQTPKTLIQNKREQGSLTPIGLRSTGKKDRTLLLRRRQDDRDGDCA